MIRKERVPFIALAFAALAIGLVAGLARIGWSIMIPNAAPHHGAIMIGGFLGTLISLEKVIPLKKKSLLAVPFASALSVIFFLTGFPAAGYLTLIVASMALTTVFVFYLWRERSLIYLLMSLGAIAWTIGNINLMLTFFYPSSVPWWIAFALFVIVSERIELMKFLPVSENNKRMLAFVLLIFITASGISFHGSGSIVAGASLIIVAIWLLRYDLIGISVKKTGLTRFVAVSLLFGYFSLLLAGVFLVIIDAQLYGYDAIVHVFFIGFVFSMIFAHGPIIMPGVLGISVKPYHRILYVWLVLLHSSWILRVIGDLLMDLEMRKYSGLISGIVIPAYLITIAYLILTTHSLHAKAS